MAKFENVADKITDLSQEWDGRTGEAVEDFICTLIEKTQNQDIESIEYDKSTYTFSILKKNGEKLETEISVVPATYSYGLYIEGIKFNDEEKIYKASKDTLVFQYTANKTVKIGVALYAISVTTSQSNRIGPFEVKFTYGTQSEVLKVKNLDYEDCVIDSSTGEISSVLDKDKLAWIDITKLFKKSQIGETITALLVADESVSYSLDLPITTEIIDIQYNGTTILNNNLITFSLVGATASDYHIEGFNNGVAIKSDTVSYTKLSSGLNKLVVKAVRNTDSSIYTDYLAVDVIYTVDCTESVVAINNVNSEISNNGVSQLYELTVYSPNKESVAITTYLEDYQTNNPTEIMKYEIVSAQSYDDRNTYTTSYSKYIEINSNDSTKYLFIKIDDNFYEFYEVDDDEIYGYDHKQLSVEAVNRNFIYYQDVSPSLNFDLNTGYLNDVFVTADYASDSNPKTTNLDGWTEESGRTIFRVPASSEEVLINPISLGLTNLSTIEMAFKTYNISDETKPVLTFGKFQLRPTLICWDTGDDTNDTFTARNSLFEEDKEIHILITIQGNYSIQEGEIYYPYYLYDSESKFLSSNTTINLVRVYINGVIDREIALTNAELTALSNAALQVNPTTADIDFYLFRVYNNIALTFDQVKQNYISFLLKKADKQTFYDNNDILGSNGEISFTKAVEKYNTLVYVFPTGGRFPSRTWGGKDGSPDFDQKTKPVTLFVNYSDENYNKTYGGRLTCGLVKGQGSSAMRYWIWNVAYQLNKIKNKNGDKKSLFTPYEYLDKTTNKFVEDAPATTGYYVMPPYDGQVDQSEEKITKLVGKVNYASSMQSHKVGACKLYDDAYKNKVSSSLITGGRKAVHEEPFLYFYWETDLEDVQDVELADILANDSDVKFMGFQTWGAAKGDNATFGYSSSETPGYLLIEGGENNDPAANFIVPWQALQRAEGSPDDPNNYKLTSAPTISSADSLLYPYNNLYINDESIYYNLRGSLDIDYGINDAGTAFTEDVYETVKKFREFYDFVYKYDFTMIQTSDNTPNNWKEEFKYIVTNNTFNPDGTGNLSSHKIGDIYRYDHVNSKWVPAGTEYDNGSWAALNIYTLAGTTSSKGIAVALANIKKTFLSGIQNYVDIDDVCFHQALVKFLSGTDNRAKNTYYQITEKDYKIRMLGDDLDTILVTDNNGLQSKPYNLLETSYKEENADYWGDLNNIFFVMIDRCFEDKIKDHLKNIIDVSFSNSTDVDNTNNYFNKVFFNVQETFPAIAFNHTAKIYYENAQLIKNSGVLSYYLANNIEPIEQSHGSNLSCEKQFMKKRLNFLTTYALTLLSDGHWSTSASGGSVKDMHLVMEFEPYLDFYPSYECDGDKRITLSKDVTTGYSSIDELAETGKTYKATISDKAINQGLYSINLYKKLNILGLLATEIKAPFSRLTKLEIDNNKLTENGFDSDYAALSISSFTPTAPVLENLTLNNMTLPDEIDLSDYTKLKSVDFTGTTVQRVILPTGSNLTSLILPNTLTTLEIYNNPNLTTIDYDALENLETLYIECDKATSLDINTICEQLIDCSTLKSVTLRNANLYITEDAINRLARAEYCEITGTVNIVTEGTTLKDISYSTKKNLIETFGTSVTFNYVSSVISDFSYAKEVSVFRMGTESGTVVRPNPFGITVSSGNNVAVTNGRLDITYSMTNGGQNSINSTTGDITLVQESSTNATVTIVMKLTSGKSISRTATVKFAYAAPDLGDFAYADGSFSSAYDSSKTLVGLVYAKDGDDTSGKVYIIGKEYFYNKSEYTGFAASSDMTSTDTQIITTYKITQYVENTWGLSSYDNVSIDVSGRKYIDSIIATSELDWTFDYFNGKADTLAYVDHVNNNLIPAIKSKYSAYIDSNTNEITNFDGLYNKLGLDLKNTIEASSSDEYAMSSVLYPYFYRVHLYEPTVNDGEVLDEQYRQGNWYAPSSGEYQRIVYYRGYSVSGTSFNTPSTVYSSIKTDVTNAGTVKGTPIFSLAMSRMGSKFPEAVWGNFVGSTSGSASIYNPVTDVATGTSYLVNKGYQSYTDYSKTNYEWVIGEYSGTGNWYYNTDAKKAVWRFTKHQGVPFTEYNYSKPTT